MDNQQDIDSCDSACLALSCLENFTEALDLLPFLPKSRAEKYASQLDQLKNQDRKSRKQHLLDMLRRISAHEEISLSKIHHDYLLDEILKEPPHLVAILLRSMPAETVRELMENMPKDFLDSMPSMADTCAVDPELLKSIRFKFKESFLKKYQYSDETLTSAEKVLLASDVRKISKMLKATGVAELSLAFMTLPENTSQALSTYLSPEDSVGLREKMTRLRGKVQQERLKKAQSHLLALDLSKTEGVLLTTDMGLYLLARAFPSVSDKFVDCFCYRLSISEAYKFRHYLQKNKGMTSDEQWYWQQFINGGE